MPVVRAWPDRPPAGRPRVHDHWPRVAVDDYDYRGLADVGDDVITLDWDQAIDLLELREFAGLAATEPDRVLVAPTLIYCDGDAPLPEPVWNVKRYQPGMTSLYWCGEGTASCHLFGFGMVYLPAVLVKRFLAERPGACMNDTTFSTWHHMEVRAETRIDWATRPVHLHYPVPEGGIL